jgi:acyl-CoA synthetase (AMP-forming)/AMP-acid ligase II
MPLPDVDVKIVDAEHGERELATGEVGELIMRAPQFMTEYWNNPVETAEALPTRSDGRTWLRYRATSPISTRTASCFWSTARRI